jgi:putative toxin-antitoxin system antitoxin component (TIGR02293 family)
MAKAVRTQVKSGAPVRKSSQTEKLVANRQYRGAGQVHSIKEAAIKYSAIKENKAIVRVITDRPEFTLSPIEKMSVVEKGISKTALQNLKDKARLDYDQLAKLLNVARATLINKKGKEKFNEDVSDKILGLAEIYSYGYEVFEDRDRFNEWVFSSNRGLGGQAPFDILHNSFGREEVKNLIGRIDYGIY